MDFQIAFVSIPCISRGKGYCQIISYPFIFNIDSLYFDWLNDCGHELRILLYLREYSTISSQLTPRLTQILFIKFQIESKIDVEIFEYKVMQCLNVIFLVDRQEHLARNTLVICIGRIEISYIFDLHRDNSKNVVFHTIMLERDADYVVEK